MDAVETQYETYPYPARDPADEKTRLITGSPSWPVEMDHLLWGGARDWSEPLRVLVAGGGTGDALIQLAQVLSTARRPYDITYLDMSRAAREIAEARAAVRGLTGIRFETGSLLDAPAYGRFDYIDCCGVLHHLPDPQAGFDALAAALAPGGGLGFMVYAPLGRSGVYPLQAAFGALFANQPPEAQLAGAKAVLAGLPEGHPFKCNPHLVDHEVSDAGFYDLLLHSRDRSYSMPELLAALDQAGLALAGMAEPRLFDPSVLLPEGVDLPEGLDAGARMALAENLRGTLKTHSGYARRKGEVIAPPFGKPDAVPHLRGVGAQALAQQIAKAGRVALTSGGIKQDHGLPKAAAPLIAGIDGRRSLGALRQSAGLDVLGFGALWGPVERVLCGAGFLHYSRLLVSGKRGPTPPPHRF